jgi:short-subunit dehydrogenase
MARRTIEGSRAVVTGASSGIGREIARELARRGAQLIVTARRTERLIPLVEQIRAQGGHAELVAGDITSAEVRRQVLDAAQTHYGGLDILINNAGQGAKGSFLAADAERLRQIMEVNFFAPAELIRSALLLLRHGIRPIVVNIGSVLGHRAVPYKSEYCASKFAIHGFSDSLRAELSHLGIDLLVVSPSTTRSELYDHTTENEPTAVARRHWAMPAHRVAVKTARAIERGRHEVILSAGGKSLVWLDRLVPPLADRLVARFG